MDDEPIALDILTGYVRNVDVLELAGRCGSGVEAFSVLQSKAIDLLFLDIQMPQLSGLDLLRTLPHPPKAIITSAYRDYALDGYELDVLDYLIKPISFERFMKAVGKVLTNRPVVPPTLAIAEDEPFIFVKADRKLVRLNLRDIISLESLRDYVKITTLEGSVFDASDHRLLRGTAAQRAVYAHSPVVHRCGGPDQGRHRSPTGRTRACTTYWSPLPATRI